MPLFVVEDGTGKVDSNSYGVLAEADLYHESRGNTKWLSYAPHEKQAALVRATDYLDSRYGALYIGSQKGTAQALDWPRLFDGKTYQEVYGGDSEIPKDLRYACYEYATRAAIAPLAPDPIVAATGHSTVVTMERVGEIERRYELAGGSVGTASLIKPYPSADIYMRDLLRSGYGGDRVIR